jgi:hypothetical protein
MSPTTAAQPARVPFDDRDEQWLEGSGDPFYVDYYEAE